MIFTIYSPFTNVIIKLPVVGLFTFVMFTKVINELHC